MIKTPLWTEHPEKLKLVAEDDEWVAPEFVADVMVSLVEGGVVSLSKGLAMRGGSRLRSGDEREGVRQVAVGGGMILEVAKGRVRVVEQFNDAGPSGEGNTLGNIGEAEEEIFASLQGRGGGWGVD